MNLSKLINDNRYLLKYHEGKWALCTRNGEWFMINPKLAAKAANLTDLCLRIQGRVLGVRWSSKETRMPDVIINDLI